MHYLLMSLLITTSAASPSSDAPSRLTEAKLVVDSGRPEEGAAFFAALATDESVPPGVRCEAWVRQAAALAVAGKTREAAQGFIDVNRSACGRDVEAMRILAEAVTGIEQDPVSWRGVREPVHVVAKGDWVTIRFGSDEPASGDQEPVALPQAVLGEPVSFSMEDARLADVFLLFSHLSGVPIRLDPPELGEERIIRLVLTDVPWEQALTLVLQSNRLQAKRSDSGLRIFRSEQPAVMGTEALLAGVRECLAAFHGSQGRYPVAEGWVEVSAMTHVLEPSCRGTLPRFTLLGRPILYRSADGSNFELGVDESR